jgi:hypothetical protein
VERGIGFWNTEIGASARFLWSLVPKRKRPSLPPTDEPKDKPPIDLKHIYGKFIYGRGVVVSSSRIREVLTLANPAAGIGFGIELRGLSQRANITIGYAKSRQSTVHQSGLLILGVDFDF